MIVNRREAKVKPGKGKEALELLKAESKKMPIVTARFYLSAIGPFNTIAWEIEFESLAAYEKWVTDNKGSDEFWKKWLELVVPGGESLIWTLV